MDITSYMAVPIDVTNILVMTGVCAIVAGIAMAAWAGNEYGFLVGSVSVLIVGGLVLVSTVGSATTDNLENNAVPLASAIESTYGITLDNPDNTGSVPYQIVIHPDVDDTYTETGTNETNKPTTFKFVVRDNVLTVFEGIGDESA